jgi:protease-4
MELLKKIFTFLSLAFGLLICLSVLAIVVSIAGLVGGSDSGEFNKLKVKTDRGVGVVELNGNITSSDSFRKAFKKMIDHDKIKSILVRIDSPGGAVGASEELYRIIRESSKPTVCSMANVAASGGLYAAMGCDKVFANKGTITGSIGVILMMPNFSEIAQDNGLKMNVVKSGELKDVGSPFKPFSERDKGFLQGVVDQSYQQFVSIISESRKIPEADVRKFADGRIILGERALDLGLIDSIGGIHDAAKMALQLHDKDEKGEPELVFVSKVDSFADIFQQLDEVLSLRSFFEVRQLRLLFM